jgi:hypothetical protein
MTQTTISISDTIRFRVAVREGMRTVTRKVTGFYNGKPTVAYRGYRDFVVAWREILLVNGYAADDVALLARPNVGMY